MIKDNQKYFNRLLLVLDVLIVMASYLISWLLKFKTDLFDHAGNRLSFNNYMNALWLIVPGYLMLYLAFHLYTSKRVQGRRLEIGNIIKANVLGVSFKTSVLHTVPTLSAFRRRRPFTRTEK